MIINEHYVRSEDDTPIAYNVVGEGEAFIFANGFTTSNFFWYRLHERLHDRIKLVTYDYKGHGNSGPARSPEGATIEALVSDMRRVMDAAEVERGVLVGFSMGSQVVLEAWRHYPERISAIIPVLGPYRRMLDTVFHPSIGRLIHWILRTSSEEGFSKLMRSLTALMHAPFAYRLGVALGLVGEDTSRGDIQHYIDHFGSLHAPTVQNIGLSAQRHSAEDILEEIDVPVLIIVGGQDIFSPYYLGHHMRDAIPESELIFLPEATHTGLFERPDAIGEAIERFCRKYGLL